MRAPLLVLAIAGCSTTTLRIGGVMVGHTPAFQASIEIGTEYGDRHAVAVTHDHGMAAGPRASYVAGLNVDFIESVPDLGPIARLGARLRATDQSAAIELRSAVFTGIWRDERTHSGGMGIELAGGADFASNRPVLEASIVMHARMKID